MTKTPETPVKKGKTIMDKENRLPQARSQEFLDGKLVGEVRRFDNERTGDVTYLFALRRNGTTKDRDPLTRVAVTVKKPIANFEAKMSEGGKENCSLSMRGSMLFTPEHQRSEKDRKYEYQEGPFQPTEIAVVTWPGPENRVAGEPVKPLKTEEVLGKENENILVTRGGRHDTVFATILEDPVVLPPDEKHEYYQVRLKMGGEDVRRAPDREREPGQKELLPVDHLGKGHAFRMNLTLSEDPGFKKGDRLGVFGFWMNPSARDKEKGSSYSWFELVASTVKQYPSWDRSVGQKTQSVPAPQHVVEPEPTPMVCGTEDEGEFAPPDGGLEEGRADEIDIPF